MSTATDMLAAYQAAELAVLNGTSYRIGDLQLTRANLNEVISGRQEWQRAVNAETRLAAGQSGPISVHVSDFSDGTAPPDGCGDSGSSGPFGWNYG